MVRDAGARAEEWDFALAVSRMALSELALREVPATVEEDGWQSRAVNERNAGQNTATQQETDMARKVLAEARTLCEPFEEGRLHAQKELVKGLREAIDRTAVCRK